MKLLAVIFCLFLSTQSQVWEQDWWEESIIYQIYPRSFKDSDGDGVGDIRGIIDNLDHLIDLGATGLWLNPIFKSPMIDGGYDISDYRQVDPLFGSMEDLEELLAKAEELGLKVILEIVPNHTSDQHEWFTKSVYREPGFEDFYIWRDCPLLNDGTRRVFNNWISVYHTIAWTYNPIRNQCYLHQFTRQQPDLNYWNENVRDEIKDVFRFWLEKGVDGFRVQAANFLFETENLPFEGIVDINGDRTSRRNLVIQNSMNRPQSYQFILEVRQMMDNFTAASDDKKTRLLMTEAYAAIAQQVRWYGTDEELHGAHWPSNMIFVSKLDQDSTAHDFKSATADWMDAIPPWGKPNWALGNHDNSRVAFRYVKQRAESMAIMSLTLPGPNIIYYGDEILMTDNRDITFEETVDPKGLLTNSTVFINHSRDPERTPFQWDNSTFAGFSNTTGRPWLPVNSNYRTDNLQAQKEASVSTFKLYQRLIMFRKAHPTLQRGGLITKAVSDQVFGFMRTLAHVNTIAVFVNLRGETTVSLKDLMGEEFNSRTRAWIMVSTTNTSLDGQSIQDVQNIKLEAFDALVLEVSSASKLMLSMGSLIIVNILRHLF